jgi:hypothetical protein
MSIILLIIEYLGFSQSKWGSLKKKKIYKYQLYGDGPKTIIYHMTGGIPMGFPMGFPSHQTLELELPAMFRTALRIFAMDGLASGHGAARDGGNAGNHLEMVESL